MYGTGTRLWVAVFRINQCVCSHLKKNIMQSGPQGGTNAIHQVFAASKDVSLWSSQVSTRPIAGRRATFSQTILTNMCLFKPQNRKNLLPYMSIKQIITTLITWKKKYAAVMKSSCLKDQLCCYVHDEQGSVFQRATWALEHFFLKNQQEKMK